MLKFIEEELETKNPYSSYNPTDWHYYISSETAAAFFSGINREDVRALNERINAGYRVYVDGHLHLDTEQIDPKKFDLDSWLFESLEIGSGSNSAFTRARITHAPYHIYAHVKSILAHCR